MGLRIEVLGPLRVRAGRQVTVDRSSHRRLLAILAFDANRRLSTDVLIDRYWGDAVPATAKAALQTHISALRKLLPADVIRTEGYGYRLDLGDHSLDVDEFVALAAEARQATRARRWEAALESVDAAVELWRGGPYDELRDDDFARFEISRLEEIRLELEEMRAKVLIGMGSNQEALAGLEPLVRAHPLRERLWEQLMLARYRLGRHAEALAAYREAWAAFAELGLEPSESLRRLEQKILLHDESVRQEEAPHNLPVELTRFIGRDSELGEVAGLLDEHRLVTLTGVGGSGKTRLAIRVAAGQLGAFPDGCWIAELGPVRDPDHVAPAVASAMGLRPQGEDVVDALRAALAQERSLVVFDNCEHLLHASAALARALLEAAPNVHILATSREPLRVPGEALYDVPPLELPSEEADAVELEQCDAVRLFRDRASQARPGFALDDTNAEAVAAICRRLDGLPLALELAASRVSSLAPQTMAQRLDDRFRLLTGGSVTGPERHRTLEAALAWSYDLLHAREQVLFARLSVFGGGFTLDMAEDVCSDGGIEARDVVPLVSSLMEKSLVSRYGDEVRVRYRLLETVREYAAARLGELESPDSLSRRHLDWCVQFAEQVNARVYGTGRWELYQRLSDERDNLRAALECSRGRGIDDGTRVLARALAWHWWDRGPLSRVIPSLDTALAHCSDALEEAEIRMLVAAAHDAAGDATAAFSEATRAYELVADLPPSLAKVWVLQRHAAQPLHADRDPAPAVVLCRAALVEAQKTGDPVAEIRVRWMLGWALSRSGDADAGIDEYRVARDLALEVGDPTIIVDTLLFSFDVVYLHPLTRRSEPRRIAEEILSRVGEHWSTHAHRWWLAYVFLQSGEWDRARAIVDQLGKRHREGYARAAYLIARATLRWMQGGFDDAGADLATLEEMGVHPRWHHAYYPLLADVSADGGRIEDARRGAEEYLAFAVDRSQESRKLGVLAPLARAEVEAAVATSGAKRAEHVERARAAVTRAREIVETFPPLTEGSLQMETPRTYLALAEAELSRIEGSDPALWQAVVDRADYVYFRLYARFRLAEALLAADIDHEGAHELRAGHAEAARVGAARIRLQLEQLANGGGVRLTTRRRARSRF
ncbi:MAG TPA: BTAD domain-containing putative transcriptional regulator [Gaiellaceae bacterium]|nr:BTAD domain-containing putative transcriptional regulator [Gaiellaceae bacterium]